VNCAKKRRPRRAKLAVLDDELVGLPPAICAKPAVAQLDSSKIQPMTLITQGDMSAIKRAVLVAALIAHASVARAQSFVHFVDPVCDGIVLCVPTFYTYDATTGGLVSSYRMMALSYVRGLAISPDGRRVFISDAFLGSTNGPFMHVMDVQQATETGLFRLPAGIVGPLLMSHDGSQVFILASTSAAMTAWQIGVYDTAANQVIRTFAAGSGVTADFAINPANDHLFVLTSTIDAQTSVTEYDPATGTGQAFNSSSSWFRSGIHISRDGQRLYVTDTFNVVRPSTTPGKVEVWDLPSGVQASDLPCFFAQPCSNGIASLQPRGVVDAASRGTVLVWDDLGVSTVDTTAPSITGALQIANISSAAVGAKDTRAWFASRANSTSSPPTGANAVYGVDLTTNSISATIPFSGPPSGIVMTPDGAAPCRYQVSTLQIPVASAGGTSQVALTTGCAWQVSNVPTWIHASAASGTGRQTIQLTIDSDFTGSNRSAALTIGGQFVTITQAGLASTAPFGVIDTPMDYATGVTGALAVTGWALDDVGVTRVRIARDPVGGEPLDAQVYIGDATFVDGARPDVQAAYPSLPNASRAGWGLQVLTNMLPNQGTGTFRLYAYADDVDGHTTLLGFRTITCMNAGATAPFGTIDTPGQGETVSGTVVNFGWALSRALIPPDGSTIDVLVDGAAVGHPVYNNFRADIATLFPGLPNSSGPVGYFMLDTTTLTNGIHAITWVVHDSMGATQGIGSRYFWVANF
jgi:hypothetical protein